MARSSPRGLVNELFVMVTPRLCGVRDARALVELPRSLGHDGVALRLLDVERIDNGDELMLRYELHPTEVPSVRPEAVLTRPPTDSALGATGDVLVIPVACVLAGGI